ncbi:MAG: hypothetical protein HC859_07935 [Bacteroidia bacterium]|nr:hypothetical protein [Bacteroidia bacterium]
MLVPFESLPDNARIWIYQSPRALTPAEYGIVQTYLTGVTEAWAAHGQALKSSFVIRFNQFIIIGVDEDYNAASGCSVDSFVNAMHALGSKLSLDFFDRQQVAFQIDGITIISLGELKEKHANGIWSAGTPTFNNVVQAKADLNTKWIVPAGETWLKRYIPRERTVQGAENIL